MKLKKTQSNLLENNSEFNSKTRPISKADQKKEIKTFESINTLYDGPNITVNILKSEIFPLKPKQEKGLKILTPQQMLERLSIALI